MKRVSINISDWYVDAKENGAVIGSFDDILQYVAQGVKVRQVGEWTMALIHAGETPQELLPEAKRLLSDGSSAFVGLKVRTAFELVDYRRNQMKVRRINHCGVPFHSFLAKADGHDAVDMAADVVAALDQDEVGFAELGTPDYLENAMKRLLTIAPGHVRNALAEIAVSGGDVRDYANQFFAVIEGIVEQIEGEPALAK